MNAQERTALAFLLASAAALAGGPALAAQKVDIASNYRQSETVSRIEEALAKSEMMVVAKPDLQAMVGQFGTEIGGAQVILFANPKMGGMLLKTDPAVGLEMPMKFFVYEKGGKAWVSYYPHEALFKPYKNKMLDERAKMMDMMLKGIAEYAALGKEMKPMPMQKN